MDKVGEKSKVFAIRIVRLYKYLCDERKSMFCQNNFSVPERPSAQILRKPNTPSAGTTFWQNYISLSKRLRKPCISLNCCEKPII